MDENEIDPSETGVNDASAACDGDVWEKFARKGGAIKWREWPRGLGQRQA